MTPLYLAVVMLLVLAMEPEIDCTVVKEVVTCTGPFAPITCWFDEEGVFQCQR